MTALYEISQDLLELEAALADATDEQATEMLLEYRDGLHEQQADKIDRICRFREELEQRARSREAEANRLLTLVRADRGTSERLKRMVFDHLSEHGIRKLETPLFRLSLCGNGGKLPLILSDGILGAEDVPENFRRVREDIDREGVYQALSAGEELEFARLGERGEHLRIK